MSSASIVTAERLGDENSACERIRSVFSASGHLHVEFAEDAILLDLRISRKIRDAFNEGSATGISFLAGEALSVHLPPDFDWWREFGRRYLSAICHIPESDFNPSVAVPPPSDDELRALCESAPPMEGIEHLSPASLSQLWQSLDIFMRERISSFKGSPREFLLGLNPAWRLVGRVTLHLAENKKNPVSPFAFLATYTSKISRFATPQYIPLGRALEEFSGEKGKDKLLSMLSPLNSASEKSGLMKELLDSGEIFQPQTWSEAEAYRFLKEIPIFEDAGLIVRLPDWWKGTAASKPKVSVRIGESPVKHLGADSLLDFSVETTIDGEKLSENDLRQIMASGENLIRFKGRWIEVDSIRLNEALQHWSRIRSQVADGISFLDAMRLLSGARFGGGMAESLPAEVAESSRFEAGAWLSDTLRKLREQGESSASDYSGFGLKAELRDYQKTGAEWLHFMNRLGLGSCLADDMGLGKTVQVLALLLRNREAEARTPSLLVVPASLIANWQDEIAKFAPGLDYSVVHPSEKSERGVLVAPEDADGLDLVITSYGMLCRSPWMAEREWRTVIIDEAQAIKNPETRQTKAVKRLRARHRIALTGTPVENRLGDLWSIFDFINPGLLGGARQFAKYAKDLADGGASGFSALRSLTRPYILRRLKTDKNVISDLPDKTEMLVYCNLTKKQAILYAATVKELAEKLKNVDGIARKGAVLSAIMKFKQICNHPSHFSGDGGWSAEDSGKFSRLSELAESILARREKLLIFSQFRETVSPLQERLSELFRSPGLSMHGGIPVKERRNIVARFQREDGPPFLVLTVKVGGTGLNLTSASHVIHFDRWWNPAVENQATDRAFRIGQKKNVLVHKFVCRGTVEERIAAMMDEKTKLAENLLGGGGEEKMLTEMNDDELIKFVSLDIEKALAGQM